MMTWTNYKGVAVLTGLLAAGGGLLWWQRPSPFVHAVDLAEIGAGAVERQCELQDSATVWQYGMMVTDASTNLVHTNYENAVGLFPAAAIANGIESSITLGALAKTHPPCFIDPTNEQANYDGVTNFVSVADPGLVWPSNYLSRVATVIASNRPFIVTNELALVYAVQHRLRDTQESLVVLSNRVFAGEVWEWFGSYQDSQFQTVYYHDIGDMSVLWNGGNPLPAGTAIYGPAYKDNPFAGGYYSNLIAYVVASGDGNSAVEQTGRVGGYARIYSMGPIIPIWFGVAWGDWNPYSWTVNVYRAYTCQTTYGVVNGFTNNARRLELYGYSGGSMSFPFCRFLGSENFQPSPSYWGPWGGTSWGPQIESWNGPYNPNYLDYKEDLTGSGFTHPSGTYTLLGSDSSSGSTQAVVVGDWSLPDSTYTNMHGWTVGSIVPVIRWTQKACNQDTFDEVLK